LLNIYYNAIPLFSIKIERYIDVNLSSRFVPRVPGRGQVGQVGQGWDVWDGFSEMTGLCDGVRYQAKIIDQQADGRK
jgi:hypothetical protein